MRAMKRTVSVLLSLMLVLGMITIGIGAVSAAETGKIQVTSNLNAEATADYSAKSEQVAVTYKLTTSYNVVNVQGVVTFDKDVLKVADSNDATTVVPNFLGSVINLGKTDGRIPFNWSSENGTAAFEAGDVFFTVVFDIIDATKGDTNVDLNVVMMVGSTDTQAGEASDVVIIDEAKAVNQTDLYSAEATAVVTPEEGGVDPSAFVWTVGIALDGKIGLNYYFYQTPAGYEGKTISVEFDGPSDADQNITSPISAFPTTKRNGVTYHRHTYFIYSTMMSQPVNVKIYVDGEYAATHTISIVDWVDNKLADYEASQPETAKLVKDMLNYGAAAQVMFDAYTDQLANAHINYALVTVTADDIAVPEGLDVAPDLSSIGLTWQRSSVSLDSGAPIRLTANMTDSDKYNASAANKNVACDDGKNYAFTGSGTRKTVITDDVVSNELDRVFTFTFANGATYKTSIMNYIKTLLAANADKPNYVNLCSALYWYGVSAKAVFG